MGDRRAVALLVAALDLLAEHFSTEIAREGLVA
jgi:hypothetical protein